VEKNSQASQISQNSLGPACARVNPAAQVTACPSSADALKQSTNDPLVGGASSCLVGDTMELVELSLRPARQANVA